MESLNWKKWKCWIFCKKIIRKRIIFYWDWDHFNYLYDGKEKQDPRFLNVTKKLKKIVSQQKRGNDNVLFLSAHDICRDYHQKGICAKGRKCFHLHICRELYRRLTPDLFCQHHCSVDNVFLLHNCKVVRNYSVVIKMFIIKF